jgi:probable aminopeptidase NPEPL1
VATGKQHAALYCNSETLEQHAITVGRSTGDLAHALPYAPEFYRKEFNSQVADMRNSVKDRSNAQSSCAGQFLGNHISKYSGDWLHIDMASPAVSAGRGTGFGVGLLLAVSNVLNENLDH